MEARETTGAFEFRGLRLDPVKRRLYGPDGEPVALRPRAFDTLCLLVRRAGEPVSKEEILAAVWPGTVVEENNLNQAISALRQALGDDRRNPAFIATIPGRGYQFVADVQPLGVQRRARTASTSVDVDSTAADATTPARSDAAPLAPTDGPLAANAAATGAAPVPPLLERPERHRLTLRRLAPGRVAGAVAIAVLVAIAVRWLAPDPAAQVRLGTPTLVTDLPGSHSAPTLSPDGTWMAFVSDASGRAQIWVKPLPDGLPQQITSGERSARSPSWSPVDSTLLFERALEDGTPAVWRVDALGTTPPRLVVANAKRPHFSADGTALTFTRRVGAREVIGIAPLDGGPETILRGMPQSPGFTPPMPAMNAEGDIAFVHADEGPSGNLWWYRAADSSFHQLTRPRSRFVAGVWARAPVWLPDGRSLLFAAADDDPANMHLWYVKTAGGRAAPLTQGVGSYDAPAVAAHGRRVAYAHAKPAWQLVATDPDSGAERVIHESRRSIALPLASPDGNQVLYFSDHVYTVALEGGEPRQLTSGEPGEATLPSWSRDDAGIVYYYRDRQLHRLDVRNGASEVVLDDFHWRSKNWLTVHGDSFAWVQRGFELGRGRTVVRQHPSGVAKVLDEALWTTEWSRDGTRLLGRRMRDSAVVICRTPQLSCEPVLDQGGRPIPGARPRWSADERRVFFRRAQPDRPGYAWIWAVKTDGGEPQRLVQIGPYQPDSVFFSVGRDDTIIWNRYQSRGDSEIWMAELEGVEAARRSR